MMKALLLFLLVLPAFSVAIPYTYRRPFPERRPWKIYHGEEYIPGDWDAPLGRRQTERPTYRGYVPSQQNSWKLSEKPFQQRQPWTIFHGEEYIPGDWDAPLGRRQTERPTFRDYVSLNRERELIQRQLQSLLKTTRKPITKTNYGESIFDFLEKRKHIEQPSSWSKIPSSTGDQDMISIMNLVMNNRQSQSSNSNTKERARDRGTKLMRLIDRAAKAWHWPRFQDTRGLGRDFEDRLCWYANNLRLTLSDLLSKNRQTKWPGSWKNTRSGRDQDEDSLRILELLLVNSQTQSQTTTLKPQTIPRYDAESLFDLLSKDSHWPIYLGDFDLSGDYDDIHGFLKKTTTTIPLKPATSEAMSLFDRLAKWPITWENEGSSSGEDILGENSRAQSTIPPTTTTIPPTTTTIPPTTTTIPPTTTTIPPTTTTIPPTTTTIPPTTTTIPPTTTTIPPTTTTIPPTTTTIPTTTTTIPPTTTTIPPTTTTIPPTTTTIQLTTTTIPPTTTTMPPTTTTIPPTTTTMPPTTTTIPPTTPIIPSTTNIPLTTGDDINKEISGKASDWKPVTIPENELSNIPDQIIV